MRYLSLIALTTMLFIFSGCSGKQYFKPEQTYSASSASHSYGSTIVDLSREGATLKNGHYIGQQGVTPIGLGEGYRFLNESSEYVLASNSKGTLKIIDKKSKKSIGKVQLNVPVVSATIKQNLIAYILNNNTFGIYNFKDKTKVIEDRSEETLAIDTRAASPMFIESLVVMPMLDGKLIIVDSVNTENIKVVYLSSHKVFNNIIYLSRMGNTMVAATPKRLITLGGEGKRDYRANISEVTILNDSIYLFTKEGEVKRLDKNLHLLKETKFKFAHFSVATAFANRLFALDQQGSLIVMKSDLSKYKIYDLGSVDDSAFITGTKLYKDGDVIKLSKLGYE